MATTAKNVNTSERILDVAEELVQVRGFNAFSYADVAGELGITKAALHYHYPGKAELGQALVSRYAERFAAALVQIEAREDASAAEKLDAYVGLYTEVLRARRMCLCGMLAAEYQTLPAPIKEAVVGFFDVNELWLARVLEQGRTDKSLRFEGSATDTARMIVSSMEGAMLVARPYSDPARFRAAATTLLAALARPSARSQ